jgi:hypothetical protein
MRPTKVRVVFLDFDGVLNNTEYLLQNNTSQPGYVHERDDIDPIAVVLLNDLVTRGNAYAVVSSAWRIGRMRTQLCDILNGRGYKGKILDKTPEIKPYRRDQRGHEIQAWLDTTRYEVESFVILDDDTEMAHLTDRFVHVNPQYGLTKANVEEALRILDCPYVHVRKARSAV